MTSTQQTALLDELRPLLLQCREVLRKHGVRMAEVSRYRIHVQTDAAPEDLEGGGEVGHGTAYWSRVSADGIEIDSRHARREAEGVSA